MARESSVRLKRISRIEPAAWQGTVSGISPPEVVTGGQITTRLLFFSRPTSPAGLRQSQRPGVENIDLLIRSRDKRFSDGRSRAALWIRRGGGFAYPVPRPMFGQSGAVSSPRCRQQSASRDSPGSRRARIRNRPINTAPIAVFINSRSAASFFDALNRRETHAADDFQSQPMHRYRNHALKMTQKNLSEGHPHRRSSRPMRWREFSRFTYAEGEFVTRVHRPVGFLKDHVFF